MVAGTSPAAVCLSHSIDLEIRGQLVDNRYSGCVAFVN
jgi:hypothetical protein